MSREAMRIALQERERYVETAISRAGPFVLLGYPLVVLQRERVMTSADERRSGAIATIQRTPPDDIQ